MKTLFVITLILLPWLAFAQGTSTGEAELKFMYPASFLSMADATIADTASVTAYFANPASLALGNATQIMFSQMQWIQDIQTQQLAATLPSSLGSFALAISSTSVNNIPVREVPGPAIGTFNSHSTVFQLGYAFSPLEGLSAGASVKYLYDKLLQDEASGYGVDVGVVFKMPVEGLSVAAAVTNVGQMSAFRSLKTDLPTRLDLGAEYGFTLDDFAAKAALALGHEIASPGTNGVRVGGEITYARFLSVRAGYQSGYDIRGLSAGLGIKYSFIQIDYAYIPFSQGFGNANVITVGVNF